jgi:hypothetical protein
MLHVAGLLPMGDIEKPSANLQVEWFHMTFHKLKCMKFICLGYKLSKETLQSLAEYLETIHDSHTNNDMLLCHQFEKVQV